MNWMLSMFGVITTRPWPGPVAVSRSNSAVISPTPSGTTRWNAPTSTVSRFHSSFRPSALKVRPAMSSRPLRGEWPPGTQRGYSRVSGPACTGMVCLIRKMRCERLVASTSTFIMPGA